MEETYGGRSIYNAYAIDDGWHLPFEIIEEIEIRIAESEQRELEKVIRQNKQHTGEWITEGVAYSYGAKAWVYREVYGYQYIGKLREFGRELQDKYGVTELEAINILFERNVSDYVNKYYRIRNLMPRQINQQEICDEIVARHLKVAV